MCPPRAREGNWLTSRAFSCPQWPHVLSIGLDTRLVMQVNETKSLICSHGKSNRLVHELPLIREVAIRYSGAGQSVTGTWGGGQADLEAQGWGRLVSGGLWQSLELAGAGVEVGMGREGNHSKRASRPWPRAQRASSRVGVDGSVVWEVN